MVRRRAAGRYLHRRSNPHERQSGTGVGNVYAPARHVGDSAAVLARAVARSQRHDDDVGHFTAEEKAKIIASYPAHEREARTKGIPTLGSGRIFPVPEETLAIEHREFPRHWPRIGGMDFGWDHPFAAVELVWDRDTDTVYVTKTYCLR